MKKIKAFQIWNNGILVEATEFQLRAVNVELENSATFYYGLFSEDNIKLNEGNLYMDKNDYKAWGFDQYAWDWAANSDINIKTDINTIDGALDRINKVRLVSFKYKDAYKEANNGIKDKYYHNVIAQEFQEIYPDYVYDSGDVFEEHKVLQVDTNPMYVDSVSAIQELSKMVIELQNQINELKNK